MKRWVVSFAKICIYFSKNTFSGCNLFYSKVRLEMTIVKNLFHKYDFCYIDINYLFNHNSKISKAKYFQLHKNINIFLKTLQKLENALINFVLDVKFLGI